MARRAFVLLVPFALVLAACSDDDPKGSQASSTTSTTEASTTTIDGSSTTVTGAPTSTTTPGGDGIAMVGPTGSGSVVYSLDPGRSEFCYRMTVEGVGEVTEAHVHRMNGDEVLALQPPAADGSVNTCSATDALFIEEVDSRPGNFYVDAHGARGTLKATLE